MYFKHSVTVCINNILSISIHLKNVQYTRKADTLHIKYELLFPSLNKWNGRIQVHDEKKLNEPQENWNHMGDLAGPNEFSGGMQ